MRLPGKLLLAAGAVAAGGLGAGRYLMRRPLPTLQGRTVVEGLAGHVEVVRDRWGVPHIRASNPADLFFAQGYVHAQDRLWQMDFQRRVAAGRLSEVFGEPGLETDRLLRRLGLRRMAEREGNDLSAEALAALDAYSRGVNAFLVRPGRLPLEFSLLRYRPHPWSPADSLAWGAMISYGLSSNWEAKVLRARMVALLGPDKVARLEADYYQGEPLIVPPGANYEGLGISLLEEYQRLKQVLGLLEWGLGSNSWVVDGHKSATGKPLLANDPHLPPQLPSIWHEVHLTGGGYDVVGAAFPGLPGVVIGHNQRIAWGMTNAQADVQDLYLERFHGHDPNRYEYSGTWAAAEVVREEIVVRGRRRPVVEEVRITRHGPVITPVFPLEPRPLALRWTGLEGSRSLDALLRLNRAGNWPEFREALNDWTAPAQNFLYADVDGNIGYYLAGRVPLRPHGRSLLPVPGWTDEYEWAGYVPFDEMPHAYNPPTHFIVTANNRPVGDDYPYYLGHEWRNGYRARRISMLLQDKEKLTVADFQALQMDDYSLPGDELRQHLTSVEPANPQQARALDYLRAWDGHLAADSVGAAIYEVFLWHLSHRVFGHHLHNLAESYLGSGALGLAPLNSFYARGTPLLLGLLAERDPNWWTPPGTTSPGIAPGAPSGSPRGWDTALERSLEGTVSFLEVRLGKRVASWTWGRLHRLTFAHPLGTVRGLQRLLSRGPFPQPGDSDTVLQGAFSPRYPFDVCAAVPAYRQVVDLGDWKHSVMIHAPGQSGHPGSPHYDDLLPLWLAGRHHPMLFDWSDVAHHAEARLVLEPADPHAERPAD